MAFVFLGGEGASRPTYFELLAAERLAPTLKAAFSYSLSVVGQHRPLVGRLLDLEDELAAVLMLALDGHALVSSDSTFSESLYGLKRVNQDDSPAGLSTKQRVATLLVQVVLPYLHTKCGQLYTHYSPPSGVLGLAISRLPHQLTHPPPPGAPLGIRLQHRLLPLFLKAFPWVHASIESTRFVYQALYMALGARFYSPGLHLLGQRVVRFSSQDMAAAQKLQQQAWQRQLGWAGAGHTAVERLLRRALVYGWRGVQDHGRNGLILAVFGFKALEWWFLSAETKLAANQALKPPPPPPPPTPAPTGVGLPANIADCPVCRMPRTNPAQSAVSGYAFCYPCLFNHVMEHGTCPVSLLPMSMEHVRKLYDDA